MKAVFPRAILLAVVGAIYFLSTSTAHLNETREQCIARYGDVVETQQDDYGNTVLLFQKNGFDLFITFLNEKAGKIQYGKTHQDALGFGDPISDNEIQQLLSANSTSHWKKSDALTMDDEWETEDGNCTATYRSVKPLLFVMTKEYIDAVAAEKKAQEDQNLKGL